MKGLSIEEKAKRYDEVLAMAKSTYNGSYKPEIAAFVKVHFEEMFPELKESEDEKVRKEIVEYLKKNLRLEWATWLEKQGEQKPFDYENANIQQKDFAPKVEWKPSDEQMTDLWNMLCECRPADHQLLQDIYYGLKKLREE